MLAYRTSLTFYNEEIQGLTYIFSIFPIVIIFCYIFFPFPIFLHKIRIGVIKQLLKTFFPFGKSGVRLKEYISADILTSVTYPLASLTVAFCMLFCNHCRENDIRHDCKRQNIAALIIQILPYFARSMQCLNKMYYTKKKLLYLANFFKYLSKCGFIAVTYLTKISKKL